MAEASPRAIAQTLIQQYGQTFAEELGIDAAQNSPASLFQLLCAAILFSARISNTIAVNSMTVLLNRGWNSPDQIAATSWDERVEALTEGGYTRYRERTATMLGDTVQHLMETYDGDLRQLRAKAEKDPDKMRSRIKAFKGIGDVGVDIFFREVQVAWDELYPFADNKSLNAADKLGLPAEPASLAELVDRSEFAKLVAALVRVDLDNAYDEVLAAASN